LFGGEAEAVLRRLIGQLGGASSDCGRRGSDLSLQWS
jgi:hypothetical protein